MSFLDRFKKNDEVKQTKVSKRSFYDAAKVDRLTNGWSTSNASAEQIATSDLANLRSRSNSLARDDDYYKRFLQMCVTNIVGHNGVSFQSKIRDPNGSLDERANDLIEDAWKKWCKPKNCTADGTMGWIEAQSMFVESTARDGEVIVHIIRDPNVNEFGFALQLIEAEHLDEKHNETRPNGNAVRNGIERDKYGKPVAYWLWKHHPGDRLTQSNNVRVRIPAGDIIHAPFLDRPSQSRGLPWGASAMWRLNMIKGYEDAEQTAARVAASKMGVISTTKGEEYTGEDEIGGHKIMNAEPGAFEYLPPGSTLSTFDPNHPNSGYKDFMKTALRGAAAGLGTSYNSISQDLESVNYSSLRHGSAEERDNWRVKHRWFINRFVERVYEEWLEVVLLRRIVPLPFDKFEKFNKPEFRARGWQYVDPLKEATAQKIQLESGLRSISDVIRESGRDPQEVFKEIADDQQDAADLGIPWILPQKKLNMDEAMKLNEELDDETE